MTRTDTLMSADSEMTRMGLVSATAEIVSAMVAANFLPGSVSDVAAAISTVSAALRDVGITKVEEPVTLEPEVTPMVSVRKSLSSPDHIISMIDGKPYKMLRRHIGLHGFTPETYREKYGLKPDYPMTAPAYAEQRRALAKKSGLGTKRTKKR